MKTTLFFLESAHDNREVILRPSKDVHISTIYREDPLPWKNGEGVKITHRPYICITYPSFMLNPKDIALATWDKRWNGYEQTEENGYTMLFFYYRHTFLTVLYDLEGAGLFRVTQRHLPSPNSEDMFKFFINARSPYQWSYNIGCTFLQVPFLVWRKVKRKKMNLL